MTDELHHLAGAYALDALDDIEAQAFERHLRTCDSCRRDVVDYRATAAELGSIELRTPPPDLKARLFAELDSVPQMSRALPERPAGSSGSVAELRHAQRRSARRGRILTAVAASVLVLAGLAGAALLRSTDGNGADDVLAAPDAIRTDLEGEAGTLAVFWSPERDRAVVRGTGLPDAGDGKTYALWFVDAEGVTAAGLFTPVDGAVDAVVEVGDVDGGTERPPAGTGWGVTIEPDGGSPQPSGEILFLGDIT